jgi:alpha-galactosidase
MKADGSIKKYMIKSYSDGYILETEQTSYIIKRRGGLFEHLYYGQKIELQGFEPLTEKGGGSYGCDIFTDSADAEKIAYEHLCLELSPKNRGDYRIGMLDIEKSGGAATTQYRVCDARIIRGSLPDSELPGAFGGDETLIITLNELSGFEVKLIYTVYEKSNVITRRAVIENKSRQPLMLRRAASYQLDFPESHYTLTAFTGAWARERHKSEFILRQGTVSIGSRTGNSSNLCNPFFMLTTPLTGEESGAAYGFNLIYSGSHEAFAEVNAYGKLRIVQGIAADNFAWPLETGQAFATPEAALTFSSAGKNGMSRNLHYFVRHHIVRGAWAFKPRPVLVNNWEATYFRFNDKELIKIAGKAAAAGAELFVLDDGWFGRRNSEEEGLGDYAVNRKKLPHGLNDFAGRIKKLGLMFGLWVEPEMVSKKSALYKAHPDWIVETPGYMPTEGRHQYVLDLCNPEVQSYIIEQVGSLLENYPIDYIKWDMNRHIADNYSSHVRHQGMFGHSYIKGLYYVLKTLTAAYPQVLFESCASGGNRFDLGMLCYMPQIWVSDDTDAYKRQIIQYNSSYGYPLSVMGAHVSAVPNHQTTRRTPLETRFNVAAFGLLGYELDVTTLSPAEFAVMKGQIAFYKQYRELLQFGDFYRIKDPEKEPGCRWLVCNAAKDTALAGDYINGLEPNSEGAPFKLSGLNDALLYEVSAVPQHVDIESFGSLVNHVSPIKLNPEGKILEIVGRHFMLKTEDDSYTAYGSLLRLAGVKLRQYFSGPAFNSHIRLMTDFGSRLYIIKQKKL